MAYFKINNIDFSNRVSSLTVNNAANFVSQVNAAGNTVVDYINTKRKIEVGIIPLNAAEMQALQDAIGNFAISVSFLNPKTGQLENADCILPENGVSYYTIQSGNTWFQAFNLSFQEL